MTTLLECSHEEMRLKDKNFFSFTTALPPIYFRSFFYLKKISENYYRGWECTRVEIWRKALDHPPYVEKYHWKKCSCWNPISSRIKNCSTWARVYSICGFREKRFFFPTWWELSALGDFVARILNMLNKF